PVIFCVGSDNGVHVNEQNANGSWTGWTWFGASLGFTSIAAAVSPLNTAQVFAIGSDHAVYSEAQYADGSWTGWQSLGGSVTQITALSNPGYGTDVYAIAAYN